jgi:hypothetical protein
MIGAVAVMKLKRNPGLLSPQEKEGRGIYDYSLEQNLVSPYRENYKWDG